MRAEKSWKAGVVLMFVVAGMAGLDSGAADPIDDVGLLLARFDEGYYDLQRISWHQAPPIYTEAVPLGMLPTEPADVDFATEWTLVYHGTLDMPAPSATITVTSPDGSLSPGAGQSWSLTRNLGTGPFHELIRVSGIGPSGHGSLMIDFDFGSNATTGYVLSEELELKIQPVLTATDPIPDYFEPDHQVHVSGPYRFDMVRVAYTCCGLDLEPSGGGGGSSSSSSSSNSTMSASASCGCTTVTGTVQFREPFLTDNYRCSECFIRIMESDGQNNPSSHVDLGDTVTDKWGYFSLTVNHVDANGGIDPYIEIELDDGSSSHAEVIDESGAVYHYIHGKAQKVNCPYDSTCALGTIHVNSDMDVADASGQRGQIDDDWDLAAHAWQNSYKAKTRLDSASGWSPDQINIQVPVDGTTQCGRSLSAGSAWFYRNCSGTGERILLGSTAARNQQTIAHEYGHYVMWEAYGNNNWPNPSTGTCPSPHPRGSQSPQECAWKEGWADFYSLTTWHSAVRYWGAGQGSGSGSEDFDCFGSGSGTPPSAWSNAGDQVEGRIIASLWDLVDKETNPCSSSETYDGVDRNVHVHVWEVLAGGSDPQIFSEFNDEWITEWPANKCDLKEAARQNGITYSC